MVGWLDGYCPLAFEISISAKTTMTRQLLNRVLQKKNRFPEENLF